MNNIAVTAFSTTNDPLIIAKQVAEAVNKIERELQKLPVFFGVLDPNGLITGDAGALYLRVSQQGQNQAVATPHIYLKTKDGSNDGWLSLLFLGSQTQTEISAFRGSLYLKIPDELTSSASLYLKTSDDATPTGWTSL